MFHFVYCTENIQSGKIYVGKHSTKNIDDGYLGSGKLLKEAIQSEGFQNFHRHILMMCDSEDHAFEVERFIVDDDFVKDENTYNQIKGGTGFTEGIARIGGQIMAQRNWADPEFRKRHAQRMGEINKLKNPEMNRRLFAEGKMKAPDWTGRNHREETKLAIGMANSITQAGAKNSQFGTVWVSHSELKISKKIKNEELDRHICNGWFKGRKMKW
jgi:hypothetical protein